MNSFYNFRVHLFSFLFGPVVILVLAPGICPVGGNLGSQGRYQIRSKDGSDDFQFTTPGPAESVATGWRSSARGAACHGANHRPGGGGCHVLLSS